MGKKIDLRKYVQEVNVKRLEQEEIKPYLDNLNKRLSELSHVLTRETDEFVAPYISIVKGTMECLKLKHDLEGTDKVNFSFTIDPTDSGFPTVKDLYLLEKDKKQAKSVLEQLPRRDEIIELIRDRIMKARSVVNGQILLRKQAYYSKLLETTLLKEYHLNEPKLVKEGKGKRFYTLEWSCIERGSNVPVFYRICFTQNSYSPPLERKPNDLLKTIIYQSQYGKLDLRRLVKLIDEELDEIHPKLINKYIIGPYHNSVTQNSKELEDILEDLEDSILKFRVEAVASKYTRTFGTIVQKLLGKRKEKEIYGPLDDSDKRMIVSFRNKQKLGDTDEFGDRCKVYAVTQEGGIIG